MARVDTDAAPGGATRAPWSYWAAVAFLFAAVALSLLIAAPSAGERSAAAPPQSSVLLSTGWQLHTSAGLAATGAELSRPGFVATGWTPTAVPSTVMAALVKSGEIADPYFGKKLDSIPVERFTVPWWYRTEFDVEAPLPASARLVFHGINYSAEVWLNGERIGAPDQLRGAFRTFDLDVSSRLRAGKNALAVQVFPPRPGDFTIGFVDWNPKPPDRNMGVWREVELRRTGGVSLDEVFVRSELDLPTLANAKLTVGGKVSNHTDQPLSANLSGRIGEIRFHQRVALAPREQRQLRITTAEAPQLLVRNPKVWWPNNLGEPNLYRLELEAEVGGEVSDRQQVDFGIRQVADYVDADGHRGYIVNGKKVLVRGGGWADDLLLADDSRRLEDQIRYVKHLNLNTIRLEGFWGSTQELYDLADRYGIMVWVGWSCQWEWEPYLGAPVDPTYGGIDTEAEMELITASLRDQVVRLRNHPSVAVWNLGSDMLPKPDLERRYRTLLADVDPTRPPLAACSVRTSDVSGPTGVKMNGPYEWVPPSYWYVDTQHGGAFGFNTETGPGAQPPPLESIQRMLPREHWWPIDEMWDYHCGRGEFKDLRYYVAALDGRYGKSTSLEDFAHKAQLANYEGMRAMFEAFSLRRPTAKGVVQWMLNSAWPDMFWQLYDWYLVPNGAYFGARTANQPLHIAYDYGRRSVVAVNDTTSPLAGATADVKVFDVASRQLLTESRQFDLPAEGRHDVFSLPALAGSSKDTGVYFLDLRLRDRSGAIVARNFYWLPREEDVLDTGKHESDWYVTRTSRYADLTAIGKLEAAKLEVTHRFEPAALPSPAGSPTPGQTVHVTLRNPGDQIAFFVELSVVGNRSGRLAAPILWDDNYVSLLPGEQREISGTMPAYALDGEQPVFRYRGINQSRERAASSGSETGGHTPVGAVAERR